MPTGATLYTGACSTAQVRKVTEFDAYRVVKLSTYARIIVSACAHCVAMFASCETLLGVAVEHVVGADCALNGCREKGEGYRVVGMGDSEMSVELEKLEL